MIFFFHLHTCEGIGIYVNKCYIYSCLKLSWDDDYLSVNHRAIPLLIICPCEVHIGILCVVISLELRKKISNFLSTVHL